MIYLKKIYKCVSRFNVIVSKGMNEMSWHREEYMSDEFSINRSTIIVLGSLAIFGGVLAVFADIYSAYSPDQVMTSAVSVSLDSVIHILRAKTHSDHLIGSILGQFFIPFHIFGWVLVYFTMKSAYPFLSKFVFVLATYATIIGTSLHASLLYAGAVGRDNNPGTILEVGQFFDITSYSMVTAILVLGVLIAGIILSGKSLYPRWVVVISPLGYLLITGVLLSAVPVFSNAVTAFITVTGFNLPATIFNATTMLILLRERARRYN